MEKSLEEIWKDGFLKNDALVAPKVNKLYARKSIHIIDKFKRMFKINLIAIVVFAIVLLPISYFVGIPIMGAIFFVTLMVLVSINKSLLNELNKIDTGNNSYDYLNSFNNWINKQILINKKIASFMYPTIFLSIVLGFWFKDAEGVYLGQRIVHEFLVHFPNLYMVGEIPLIGILIILFIVGILAIFGGRIYMWDLNIVYGRILKKLNELLTDIEDINK